MNIKNKRENNPEISFLFAFVLFLIFTLSYIYFLSIYTSNSYIPKNSKITNLEVSFSTKDEVSLNYKLKLDDNNGLKVNPYSFKVTNNSSDMRGYIVYLEDVFLESNYAIKNIRVNIEKNNISKSTRNLYRDNKRIILDSGKIDKGETIKYDMRFWINEKYNINQAYSPKILVDGYNL